MNSFSIYQWATAVTLASFMLLMTVAVRERVPGGVALYALWCGVCAFATFALSEMPEYREIFYRLGLRYVAVAFVAFAGWELWRLASGRMTGAEGLGAGALVLAFLASSAIGEVLQPSTSRIWAQCAAVTVPVLVAAVLLMAGPLERPALAPLAAVAGPVRAPMMVGRANAD